MEAVEDARERTVSGRTYNFGGMGRQLLDSMFILMPGISKSMIINTALFRLVYEINQELRDAKAAGEEISIRMAFNRLRMPIEEVAYRDLLMSVSPDTRHQTELDSFVGCRLREIEESVQGEDDPVLDLLEGLEIPKDVGAPSDPEDAADGEDDPVPDLSAEDGGAEDDPEADTEDVPEDDQGDGDAL